MANNEIIPRHFNWTTFTKHECYIIYTTIIITAQMMLGSSNGWRVEVCTDEQVKHAYEWEKYATIRVMRQKESNAVNTTFLNKSVI